MSVNEKQRAKCTQVQSQTFKIWMSNVYTDKCFVCSSWEFWSIFTCTHIERGIRRHSQIQCLFLCHIHIHTFWLFFRQVKSYATSPRVIEFLYAFSSFCFIFSIFGSFLSFCKWINKWLFLNVDSDTDDVALLLLYLAQS